MLIIRIVGMALVAIAALIGIYSRWYPEDERTGRKIWAGGTHVDFQRAIDRVGEPYFWTDRNLAILAAILTIVGLALSIFALVSRH